MIVWGLLLYYLVMFLPTGVAGYEWVATFAPKALPNTGSPWIAYAAMMGAALALAIGTAAAVCTILPSRDDQRWTKVLHAGSGSLGRIDLLVVVLAVGALVYAVGHDVPLHGVLAAVLPALLLLLPTRTPKSASEAKTEDPAPSETPEESAPPPTGVRLEPLILQARRHAGEISRRDTHFRNVRFDPPPLNDPRIADPEPYVVSWVVDRDELVRAQKASPAVPWGQTTDGTLVAAIREGAAERSVALLAEQVAGSKELAVEWRVARLRSFVDSHFGEDGGKGRPRCPVTCLVEAKADAAERQVLLLALVLSQLTPEIALGAGRNADVGLSLGVWRSSDQFGLALEGVPGPDEVLPGLECFIRPVGDTGRDERRYVLLDANVYPDRVLILSPGRPRAPIGRHRPTDSERASAD